MKNHYDQYNKKQEVTQVQVIDNPMHTGYSFLPPTKPDAICTNCGAELFDHPEASARSQMSASGKYCEDCIDKLDTPESRFQWLTDNDLQAKFLEWFFAKENEKQFDAGERAAAKWYVDKWHGNKKLADECDGYLKDYINDECGYVYLQWLLDAN